MPRLSHLLAAIAAAAVAWVSPGLSPSRHPLVGAAAEGDAVATWLGSDGTFDRVQAAPIP